MTKFAEGGKFARFHRQSPKMEALLERLADLHPDNLRYLFYLVTPAETTFANIEDDYMEKVRIALASPTLLG